MHCLVCGRAFSTLARVRILLHDERSVFSTADFLAAQWATYAGGNVWAKLIARLLPSNNANVCRKGALQRIAALFADVPNRSILVVGCGDRAVGAGKPKRPSGLRGPLVVGERSGNGGSRGGGARVTRLKSGVIGLGWVCTHRHLPLLLRDKRFEVVSVADRDPAPAASVACSFGVAKHTAVAACLGLQMVIFAGYNVCLWSQQRFGALDPAVMMRVEVPAAMLMMAGMQVAMSAFLLEVVRLTPRAAGMGAVVDAALRPATAAGGTRNPAAQTTGEVPH